MANADWGVDMRRFTFQVFEALMRLLLPAEGRHRSGGTRPVPSRGSAPAVSLRRSPRPVLRGEDIGLVRPYLVAHERVEELRRQRTRRRALWLAVHGIDVGPCLIHGVEVAT